jgi:hypothetical protein
LIFAAVHIRKISFGSNGMIIKVTSSSTRRYVQLVEAFRDAEGRPKQRTVAILGRLDQLDGQLESAVADLQQVIVTTLPESPPRPKLTFESARDYGDVWALTELMNASCFDPLRGIFRRRRNSIDIEALVRVMVFNRVCDPESELGVLRWLETVALPGLSISAIDHQQLLRAMDALVDHQEEIEAVFAGLLRPLVDQELAVVFNDMTTIRTGGLSQQPDNIRKFGMAKEGLIARHVMLGVVQTAEGLSLYHEVLEGNTAEVITLKSTLKKIVQRFPVKRIIAVVDRGLLSTDNLSGLQAITLPGGAALEFILAVPGRRYSDFIDLLAPFHTAQCVEV